MIYSFEGGGNIVEVKVDKDRNFFIKSTQTNLEWVKLTKDLFKGKQRKDFDFMMKKVPTLTQKELDVYIVLEFGKMGYNLLMKK